MADLTIEVTFLCGHTKQVSGNRAIEVLEEIPFQPDPNRLKFVSTKFCDPDCRNSAGDQQPALTPHPPNTAPTTGNAGPITNQATAPATAPSAAATSVGPVAILPYAKPAARTSQKPALNQRARALSNPKRNDANRVTKPAPSGTRLPIRSRYGPNDANKPARGGNIDPALGGGGNDDDEERSEKKTEKPQALGKGKTTSTSGRTGEANAAHGVPRVGFGRSNINQRGEAEAPEPEDLGSMYPEDRMVADLRPDLSNITTANTSTGNGSSNGSSNIRPPAAIPRRRGLRLKTKDEAKDKDKTKDE